MSGYAPLYRWCGRDGDVDMTDLLRAPTDTTLRAGTRRLVETTMGLAVAVTCPLCGRYDMVFFRIGS